MRAGSEQVVRELLQQAGLAARDDELPAVAALYDDVQQMLDTIESVELDVGEESALTLDLFAWEGRTDGPILAGEGEAR